MIVKHFVISVTLLLSIALPTFADISRVEAYHARKQHHLHNLFTTKRDTNNYIRPYKSAHHRTFHQHSHRLLGDSTRPSIYRPMGYDDGECRGAYRRGEMVKRLPFGAREVFIENHRYYRYKEYLFRPRRVSGIRMYVVINL